MSHHLESTLERFARALSRSLVSERVSSRPGLLQMLDPRVRVAGLLMLVIAVVICRRLDVIAALLLLAVGVAVASSVSVFSLAKRVWLIIFVFTGLIALPALFITPGRPVLTVLSLPISAPGLRTAVLLILRVETAATLTTLLVLCTPWTHILKALRSLRLPPEIVTLLAMTHRYLFLLIETATQMFESRKSRTVGTMTGPEQRKMTTRTAGVLLSKSIELSHDVYLATLSRGFRGDVCLLTDFRMKLRDYAGLATFVLIACAAVWKGR